MMRRPGLALTLFLLFLFRTGSAVGQEPAIFAGGMSVRYEEAPGNFHYVFPCKMPIGSGPESGNGAAGGGTGTTGQGSPALCWPVVMSRVQMVMARLRARLR